ncbi:hypothetical protein GCM10025868_27440 [Angustibacter aerolatus]|uniref:FtsK domain-containing protein n=1 Tax=Angustibacter aerolatus TaxID=1162965 RepID=A0ABQ6JI30_9ACTN|nr:FtsK/SpoIIIE domain-containing protein [Angustibacter aerolatus]GMA87494.1 hypothetical protein GCM10025868_27440 [Angustibacter aerolatus]
MGADVVLDVFDPWHIGIQGATRSGKSALSYTLLSALAYRADVLVCGVDPSGILLAPWKTGPGAAWIATGTADLTNAVDALAGVVAEMDARIRRLLDEGRDKARRLRPGAAAAAGGAGGVPRHPVRRQVAGRRRGPQER